MRFIKWNKITTVFASFALLNLFFTLNSEVFVDREHKIIPYPRAQVTL